MAEASSGKLALFLSVLGVVHVVQKRLHPGGMRSDTYGIHAAATTQESQIQTVFSARLE